eukprot:scaffold6654_cov82-Cyclotella_meneghiniana.AAC.2
MTATFIDLATATTSHYRPHDRGISLTTSPSTIDNVYLVHRLLFATNFCHQPTHFRTSSDPHHIVGDFDQIHSIHPPRSPYESKDIAIVQCRVVVCCGWVVTVSSDARECFI